jgi:azurin
VFVPAQAPAEMVLPFKDQPMGQGNAFISPLRDIDYGRIYRIVYKKAKPYSALTLKKEDTPGLLAALQNDNMFWRMTAQRLLVEAKDQAAIPGLYKIINEQKTDEIGLASPAVHALWTLHGFGVLEGSNAEAMQVVINALSSKTPGVRKAAVAVLPKNTKTADLLLQSKLVNDPDLNVRMNVIVAIAALPSSAALGKLIYEATLNTENEQDEWISKALLGAAITHQDGFKEAKTKSKMAVTAQNNLNKRISDALNQEVYNLPRRGSLSFPPDVAGKEIMIRGTVSKGRQNLKGFIMGQGGKEGGYGLYIQDGRLTMAVKQNGKIYKVTSPSAVPDSFSFVGHIVDKGEMKLEVNGRQVANGKAPSLFMQPLVSTLRIGQDVDNENKLGDYEGGFRLEGSLQNANLELKKPGSSAASKTSTKSPAIAKGATSSSLKPATINIRVVENIMKYDKKLITVKAGQKVIINFSNPDNMQHNLVITQKGMLEKVGAAADAMLQDPKAAAKNYVPRIPEVLHYTRLLNVDEEVTLQFTAPSQPGDYPFVCTFPGHWRIMNGILRVVK